MPTVVTPELRSGSSARYRMRRLIQITLIACAACSPQPVAETSDATTSTAGSNNVASRSQRPMSAPTGEKSPAAGEPAASPPASSQQPKLAVDADGLRWFLQPGGSARPLPFGTAQADVLASLERVRGPAGTGTNEDCGAGSVQYASWPDGLSLVFQDGRFVGWRLDRRAAGALATANGVGPDTDRRELADSFGTVTFQKTTLGTEFAAGGLFGVLDGAGSGATITDMWAGVSCVAR